MTEHASLAMLARRSLMPAICLCLIGYFASHALVGTTGLSAWPAIRAEHAELTRQAELVARRKADLEHKVELLDPRGVDPDYADELVRAHLGVVRPDEVVIALDRAPGEPGR
jgi:cell division protein FtsB